MVDTASRSEYVGDGDIDREIDVIARALAERGPRLETSGARSRRALLGPGLFRHALLGATVRQSGPRMAASTEPAPSSSDRLIEEFNAHLREVELVVGARIMASWAQASELSLEEARLLLVFATTSGPSTAGQLGALSGISIDDVYPALGRLRQRGYVREDQRRYALTGAGEESVASLEAARRAGIEAYVSDLGADDRRQLESALGLDA